MLSPNIKRAALRAEMGCNSLYAGHAGHPGSSLPDHIPARAPDIGSAQTMSQIAGLDSRKTVPPAHFGATSICCWNSCKRSHSEEIRLNPRGGFNPLPLQTHNRRFNPLNPFNPPRPSRCRICDLPLVSACVLSRAFRSAVYAYKLPPWHLTGGVP